MEITYCHPNSETRQGLLFQHFFRSPVHQRKLWRLSYFQPSTTTWKPRHCTVCVNVNLTAAFDTVNHNVLISKIARSTLPEATCRWLANYLRGRQSVTSCGGVKSKARIVRVGVPQGSKMSPTLFSFYLADMPSPTEPVKRICYADDITIWASEVKIPELEHKINGYLTEISCFLRDNSLLISAPKSTVTLFTPDPKQANTHPKIKISDAELPLVRNPKLLGVYLDTFFSFNTHCVQVANTTFTVRPRCYWSRTT